MHGGTAQRGYTVIEVLIFMAISGFMFVVAAGFINGKQSSAELRQSLSDANTQLRSVINDVSNGFFPSNGDFVCNADSPGAPSFPALVGSPNQQGANKGCVFMGKVIQFGTDGTGGRGYRIYTIAGRQYADTTGALPTNFAQAYPVVVPAAGVTQDKSFQLGLAITRATTTASDPNGVKPLSGLGFFTSFGSYDSGGSLNSGNQGVVVVPIYGNLNEDETTMKADIATSVRDNNVDPNPSVKLCFDNGKGRYGALTLGGTASQRLATSVQVVNTASDCP